MLAIVSKMLVICLTWSPYYFSFNTLAKWAKDGDTYSAKFISCIWFDKSYCQNGFVVDHMENCRSGMLHDASFAGNLQDSKSKSCGAFSAFSVTRFVSILIVEAQFS